MSVDKEEQTFIAHGIFGILGASIVTDGERGECVDPGENGAILDAGGVEDPARQAGKRMGSWHQTVEEVRCYKLSEGTGDGLVTTSSHVYAQSMYHMYIMRTNS